MIVRACVKMCQSEVRRSVVGVCFNGLVVKQEGRRGVSLTKPKPCEAGLDLDGSGPRGDRFLQRQRRLRLRARATQKETQTVRRRDFCIIPKFPGRLLHNLEAPLLELWV